jgi:hypothetical protein
MLQSRPSSSGASFAPQHSTSRSHQTPRFTSPSSAGSYRGLSSGLVAPYAFTSTPQLTNNAAFLQNSSSPHLRPQNRTFSAPNLLVGSQQPSSGGMTFSARQRFATSSSLSTSSSSTNSLQPSKKSMDDASITTRETSVDVPARPKSTLGLSPSNSMQLASSLPPKPSPDRYRGGNRSHSDFSNNSGPNRNQQASVSPSGSGMLAVGHLYTNQNQSQPQNLPMVRTLQPVAGERPGPTRNISTDDLSLPRSQSNVELAQRYRRRSVGSFEAVGDLSKSTAQGLAPMVPQMAAVRGDSRDRRHSPETQRPVSSHAQHGSSESVSSTRSARSTGQHSVSL